MIDVFKFAYMVAISVIGASVAMAAPPDYRVAICLLVLFLFSIVAPNWLNDWYRNKHGDN